MTLPNWPGAAAVYSKAYRKLELMARSGHATAGSPPSRGWIGHSGYVSPEMRDLIEALDRGDENRIKAYLMFDIKA